MSPRVKHFSYVIVALTTLMSACGTTRSGGGVPKRSVDASLVLDWYPNSDHGGVFAAIRQGFFKARGISVHAYVPSDTSAQISLVAAGRADFGISYETDLLLARAKSIPVRSVMCITQHPLNTIMSLRSSGITRPRDLQGHSVGIAGSPSDIPIITAMVRHDGGSIKRVRIVNVSSALLPALLAHKVDAVMDVYWTWEAILAQAQGAPVNVMRVEKWGVPNYCELVLIANEQTITKRPSLVRATVRALEQAYRYAASNPVAAWADLHAEDRSLKKNIVLRSLRLLGPIILDAPTIGFQAPGQWKQYEEWLWANRVISRPVDPAAAYTNAFLMPGGS